MKLFGRDVFSNKKAIWLDLEIGENHLGVFWGFLIRKIRLCIGY